MNLSRRSFLGSAVLLVAAPAIVRYSSLMPVRAAREWSGLQSWWNRPDTIYIGLNGEPWVIGDAILLGPVDELAMI